MVAEGHAPTSAFHPQIEFVFCGSLALAVGSAMLLVPPLAWLILGDTTLFVLQFPAVVVHFVGWMLLLASLKAFPPDTGAAHRRLARGMLAIWVLGFVTSLIGIGTLPLAFPELYCTIICLPRGWLLLRYFPFVPSVFAPVVVCHAAFFLVESRMLGPLPARTVTRAAQLLGGLAVTSIAIQAVNQFSGWAYLLAGLTAPGYVLAAIGLRRAMRDGSPFTGIASGAAPRSEGL